MTAHELCLVNLSIPDAEPLELIDAAASAGFDSVSMWLTRPASVAERVAGERAGRPSLIDDPVRKAAVRRRLVATGVSLFAASSGWLTAQFDPGEVHRTLAGVAELGGRSIALIGWDPERGRLIEHLGRVCAEARQFGLQINVECLAHSTFPTLAAGAAMLAEVNAANLKITVDALALARSGGMPKDVRCLPAHAIASVQLCDAPLAPPLPEDRRDESLTGRLYPGEGQLPLVELMGELPPHVPVEVETPVRRDARLPYAERARHCIAAARQFLASMEARV